MKQLPQIKSMIQRILASRKNANEVVELIGFLEHGEKEDALFAVTYGLSEFFRTAIRNGELKKDKSSQTDTVEEYRAWVKERYNECISAVVGLTEHESTMVKHLCVETLFKFMVTEAEALNQSLTPQSQHPDSIMAQLLNCTVTSEAADDIIVSCTKYWEYDDVRFSTLKTVTKCFERNISAAGAEEKRNILGNMFCLLKSIAEKMPADVSTEQSKILVMTENVSSKLFEIKEHRRAFGNAWLEFLKHDLSNNLFKRVLVLLEKGIIPNFASPVLLADFLMRSFQQGGGIALLSLHGLFILMNEHNLEYPEFYTNLYAMVHPRIFDAKYQSRFFFLLNIFLSSTHLPAYLVAAFAKKLARLTLVAPTYAVELIVTFIFNLVENNPSIRFLVNDKGGNTPKDMQNDPFNATQSDPAQCKAMESSLWELNTLKKHYLPSVVKAADQSQSKEKAMHDFLDTTFEDTFISLAEKTVSSAPMNHVPPEGIFSCFEDSVKELWSV